jgi:hypothetical protein
MSRNNEFNQGAGFYSARNVPVSPDLDNDGQLDGYPAGQTAADPLGLGLTAQPTQTNPDDAFQQAVAQTLDQTRGNPAREPLRSQGPVSRRSEFATGTGNQAVEPLHLWERQVLGIAEDGSEDHLYNGAAAFNDAANSSGRPSTEPSGEYDGYDDDLPIEVIQAQAGDVINLEDEEVDKPYIQPDGSIRHPNSSLVDEPANIKEPKRENFRTADEHTHALWLFKSMQEKAKNYEDEVSAGTPHSTSGRHALDLMKYYSNEFSGRSGLHQNDLRQIKIRRLDLPGYESDYDSAEDFIQASMDYRAADKGDEDALSRFTIGSNGYARHNLSKAHKADMAQTSAVMSSPEPKPEDFTHYSRYLKALDDHKTISMGPEGAFAAGVNFTNSVLNFTPEGKHKYANLVGYPSTGEEDNSLDAAVRLATTHNVAVDWDKLRNQVNQARADGDRSSSGSQNSLVRIDAAQQRTTNIRASNLIADANSDSPGLSREDAVAVIDKLKDTDPIDSSRKKDYSGILGNHPDLLQQANQLKTNADIVHVFTTPGLRDSFRDIAKAQPTPFAIAANDPQFNFINHSMKNWEDAKSSLGPESFDPQAHSRFNTAWYHHTKSQISAGQPIASAASLSNYVEQEHNQKGEITHFNKIDFNSLRQQYGHLPDFDAAIAPLEQKQKQALGGTPDPFHVKKHMNQQGEQAMWNRLDNSSYVIKIKKRVYDYGGDGTGTSPKGEFAAVAYHKNDLSKAIGHLSYGIRDEGESDVHSMHIDTQHRSTTAAWQMINAAMDHVHTTTGKDLGATTSTTNMSAGLIRSMSGNTDSSNPEELVKKYLGNARDDVGTFGHDGMSQEYEDNRDFMKLGCQTCGGSGVKHMNASGLMDVAGGKEHLSSGVARQLAHSLSGAKLKCEDCKGSGIDPAQKNKDDEIPVTELRHAPAGIKFGGTSPSPKMTPDEKIKHLGYDPEDPKGLRKLPGAE